MLFHYCFEQKTLIHEEETCNNIRGMIKRGDSLSVFSPCFTKCWKMMREGKGDEMTGWAGSQLLGWLNVFPLRVFDFMSHYNAGVNYIFKPWSLGSFSRYPSKFQFFRFRLWSTFSDQIGTFRSLCLKHQMAILRVDPCGIWDGVFWYHFFPLSFTMIFFLKGKIWISFLYCNNDENLP